ncbi:energy-coupling factor transporter ATPase [Peptoniphilus raoultii]|uniref:energy-coupling factor transporter ATPase n=1 Tax=Peptoniphilus raoultii TaxID=1776387 RepID=UPI0008DABE48|nr:energy-coupling factor transporter ATPase [Peptoniphilus raoultii]
MSFIEVRNLKHIYSPNTPFERLAIENINLDIELGEFIGLIGHTGSGKSTLIQHLNGLLLPSGGFIKVGDISITSKSQNLTELRRRIGLVFQYPEYQLFEETVVKDIEFGPKNLGLDEKEVNNRVRKAMEAVGLDYEKYKNRSPFELSGGLKRRVAIAGVLSMEPEVLILDEPTAGLDPRGRDEILSEIKTIHESREITIILVSHSMEDVAKIATRLIVMDKGKVLMDDKPRKIFAREEELKNAGLGVPQIKSFMNSLKARGFDVNTDCITVKEAKNFLEEFLRSRNV